MEASTNSQSKSRLVATLDEKSESCNSCDCSIGELFLRSILVEDELSLHCRYL
jgi:hypothetical protein